MAAEVLRIPALLMGDGEVVGGGWMVFCRQCSYQTPCYSSYKIVLQRAADLHNKGRHQK